MNPHLQPWTVSADGYPNSDYASDQLEFLLGYAILAPSNHNSQPWLFRINVMDVAIFADRRRALRVVDPYDRELTMACGAALYNLRVAAEYFGQQSQFDVLPDSTDPNLLARFYLGLRAETSGADVLLFQAITQRRTNRQPFRPDPVPGELLRLLESTAGGQGAWLQVATAEDTRSAVAELVAEADRRQWADRAFRQELARWIRTRPDEAADGLHAHDAGVRDWLSFAGPALVRTFDRGGGQAAHDRDIAAHSPVLALLGTNTDDPSTWVAAGQALQSVLLQAYAEGLSASFLNQPIEVEALRSELGTAMGVGGYPQALLRLGYGPEVPPTPRRAVRDVLIRHTHGHA